MTEINLRAMRPDEWDEVASLICISTNYWYEAQRGFRAFAAGPESCRLFPEVYEALDPGCCVVAEDPATRRLMGSCFYHPRETHVSLGIMNVHPNYFGRGVASRLLKFIVDFARNQAKPVRLVSSAMNLDSFSLYSRAGFVPRATFATMQLTVPKDGLAQSGPRPVRPARPDDVPAMLALEERVSHIRREKDLRFFIENRQGVWHVSVTDDGRGGIDGFLVSVKHPGSNMLGPGVMTSDDAAISLIAAELDHHRGGSPVFLIPTNSPAVVSRMYEWGARNVEVHVAQVLGNFPGFDGIAMPTFMPETA
jgi:GNAT superfamily N-acetyltransferase